jgi:hypothetical protein
MAIEMKSISNYDYLRYMTTASREISDEPKMSSCNFSMGSFFLAFIRLDFGGDVRPIKGGSEK